MLTAALDRAGIARAVERGAAGVISKSAGLDEVVDAVRRVRAGETLLPPEEVMELLRLAGRRCELGVHTQPQALVIAMRDGIAELR